MTQPALSMDAQSDAMRLLLEHFEAPGDAHDARPHTLPVAIWERGLLGPLSDFLSRPGKEFRAQLVRLAWELAGRKQAPPPELPLIVEVLHAGSLIVDDIEDDSNYRRGAPALHHAYGLPLALNAGNWLYFWPAELLSRLELPPATELALHRVIGRTLLSCHEGQALDLSVCVVDLEQAKVLSVVSATTLLKTGKLFELSAAIGGIAAGAPSHTVRALVDFGRKLGVGLQMLDDLGGLLSESRCHKGHEDLLGGRPTWPWAWAAETCDRRAYARLRELGREVIARDTHPEQLAEAFRQALGADARARVSDHLKQALAQLAHALGPSRALDEVSHAILDLEQSYG